MSERTSACKGKTLLTRCDSCIDGEGLIVVRELKIEPRGLRREQAAHYLGISPTTFDGWVKDNLMPGPKRIGGVVVWDRKALDLAFEALSGEDESNVDDVWSRVAA
jgi:predicted DNA-binding transcriptional regulator AlpA